MAPFSFNFPTGMSDNAWTDAVAPSFVQRSPEEYAQMRGVVPGTAPSAPQSNPTDYGSMLQQMIAPYRDMAQRMYSPYAMFGPGNRFATNHPQLAGGIDNAFLALANMGPSSMSAGDNISNVARGLVGANQWHRQNVLQSAMLPYEMAAPQLKMMDEVAQMQQRGAMTQAELARIPYEQAMQKRADAQSDWYMRRLNEPNEANIQLQLALRKNGVEDISKATPEQITAIQKDIDSMRFKQTISGGGGGLLGALIYGAHPPADPSKGYSPEEYTGLLSDYTGAMSGVAAGRTGAEQNAPHAFSKGQDLITAARGAVDKEFPKPTGPEFGIGWDMPGMPANEQFKSALQKHGSDVVNRNADIQQWIARGGPQRGIAYDIYAKDRSVLGGTNGRGAKPTTPKPGGGNRPPGW